MLPLGFRRVPETLSSPCLKPGHDLLQLRVVAPLVVVAKALFGIAPRARDREIFEVVGTAVVLRDDVLERGTVERGAALVDYELFRAVDALSLEHALAVEVSPLEGPIAFGNPEQESSLAVCAHEPCLAPTRGRQRGA